MSKGRGRRCTTDRRDLINNCIAVASIEIIFYSIGYLLTEVQLKAPIAHHCVSNAISSFGSSDILRLAVSKNGYQNCG